MRAVPEEKPEWESALPPTGYRGAGVAEKGAELGKGLQHRCDEQLRELRGLGLEEAQGAPYCSLQLPEGGCSQVGIKLWSQETSDRTRGRSLKLDPWSLGCAIGGIFSQGDWTLEWAAQGDGGVTAPGDATSPGGRGSQCHSGVRSWLDSIISEIFPNLTDLVS